jgi:AraC family transcriptional activator of pobA
VCFALVSVFAYDFACAIVFRRFEALLEQRHLDRWSVSDYAHALSVTPTHLNRVTRAATGDTASHLILNA